MTDGNNEEQAIVEPEAPAPEVQDKVEAEVQAQTETPETSDPSDDELYEAAEAELKGEEPVAPEPEKHLEAAEIAPDLSEIREESEAVPHNLIDAESEYIFVDSDGNQHTVKGSDAIYTTTQYHRKMQEIDSKLQQYKPLEQMFEHQKGELAKRVLHSADTAEKLATIRDVLNDIGMADIGQTVATRMQANNIIFDPLSGQQAALQAQQAEIQNQQRQFEAQQAMQADVSGLETKLGRKLDAREWAGINNVFGKWMEARNANPSLTRPTMDTAYKLATDAIRFEDANRPQQPKPATAPAARAERVVRKPTPDNGILSDDDLFLAAMGEQGISF